MHLLLSSLRKIIVLSCVVIMVSLPCSHAFATEKQCATPAEKQALDMKALQSELMVLALSCNERKQYGQFIKKFQPQLQQNAMALRVYFVRNHKRNAEPELNRFVTRLANGVAQRGATTAHSNFCASAHTLFAKALQQDKISLVKLSSEEHFVQQHGVRGCDGEKKRAAPPQTVAQIAAQP